MTTFAELPAGFADKVLSAQSTFRSVMDAMARPGSVQRIAAVAGTPAAMMRGTAAIALTLFDHDTPIWLDSRMSATTDVAKWLKFHTSAPVIADSSISSFALIGSPRELPALDRFAFGSNEYPDRSTTLILQAAIEPHDLLDRLEVNVTLFPRGIDVVLVHDDAIVAIPRTTRLVARGG
jgi:alpha-D-ribose 1-methylphosphonate 5-triphosphate synthase subunit PhnH